MNEGDAYEIEPTCWLSLCNGSMTAHYGEYAWRVAFLYAFLFSYLFFDPLAFTGRLNDYWYSLMAALVNRQRVFVMSLRHVRLYDAYIEHCASFTW